MANNNKPPRDRELTDEEMKDTTDDVPPGRDDEQDEDKAQQKPIEVGP